jgi:hypothetical protein
MFTATTAATMLMLLFACDAATSKLYDIAAAAAVQYARAPRAVQTLRTCLHNTVSQASCNGGQVGHDCGVALPAEAQQLVVLGHNIGSTPAEVERDGRLVCRT